MANWQEYVNGKYSKKTDSSKKENYAEHVAEKYGNGEQAKSSAPDRRTQDQQMIRDIALGMAPRAAGPAASRISALAQQAVAAEEQSRTTGSLLDRYNLSRARGLAGITPQRTQPGKEAGGFIGGIQRRLTELYDREEEKEPAVKAPESIVLGQMDRPYREAAPVEDERDFRNVIGNAVAGKLRSFDDAMERIRQDRELAESGEVSTVSNPAMGMPPALGGVELGQMEGGYLPGVTRLPDAVREQELKSELEYLKGFSDMETPEMTEAREKRISELEKAVTTWGEFARDTAIAGWTRFGSEIAKFINAKLEPAQHLAADLSAFLVPKIHGEQFAEAAQYNAERIKEQPAIGGLYDWAVGPADRAAERAQATYEKLGPGAEIAGEVLQNAVLEAMKLPFVLMSGGASMAGDALRRANMTFGGAVLNAAKEMAKNPITIMSYMQMYGGRYEDAVDGGADPYTAALTATITTLMNSAVEAGGGIEDLPFTKATVGEWVKMALEEGREEAVQQVIDQLGQKAYVDSSIPWFSTEDERAVVNPGVLGRNALVGALAGGLIGGPGMALNSMTGDAKPKTEDYSGAPELSGEEAETIGAAEKHPDIAPKEIRELAEEAAAAEMAEAREQEAAEAARTARETAVAAAAQRAGSEGQRRLVEQAAQAYGEDAGLFAAHYEGGDVEAYRRGFDAMYTAGRVGIGMDRLQQATSELARGLSDTAKQEIWQAGENSAVRTIAPGAKRMTTKKATNVQRKQFRVLEEIGKRYGYEFVIVDSIDSGRANAAYRTGGKRIVVAADAADGAIVQAGAHEMVHSIRSLDADGYKVLESVVLDHLADAKYFDLEYSIRERMDMYAKSGQALTREDAIEEIVAEAVPTFFTDRQAVSAFVANNRTLAEKIRDFFVEFANEVRKITEKYAVNNVRMEIGALLGKSDALTEIANTLSDALDSADEKYRAGETAASGETVYAKRNEAKNGQWNGKQSTGINLQEEAKYSLSEKKVIDGYLEAVDQNILEAAQMYRNDKNAKFGRFKLSDVHEQEVQAIKELLGVDVGGYTHSIDKNSFNHIEKRHGLDGEADQTMADLNDVARIGWVMENFDSIERAVDKNGNPVYSKGYLDSDGNPAPVIVYRKKINGVFYVSEAVADGKWKKLWVTTAFMSENKKDASQTPNTTKVVPGYTSNDESAAASTYSIFDDERKVNAETKLSLNNLVDQTDTEAFRKWFGDSKVVDENGNPRVVYHQTSGDFTVFNTDNPAAGLNDSETPNGMFFKTNDHDVGLGGSKQMAVYLKIEKPLHFANRKEANAWYRKNVDGYAELSEEFDELNKKFDSEADRLNSEIFATDDDDRIKELEAEEDQLIEDFKPVEDDYRGRLRKLLDEYFLSGKSGYDGIELDYDGHRWVNGVRENVHTFIVFEPNQIKSATDNIGTFDPENPDIRFSLNNVSSVETALSEDQNLMLPEDVNVEVKTIRAQATAALERGLTAKQNQQIDGIAKKILRQTESTYSQKDFSENVKRLIREYAGGGATEETLRAVAEMAKKIIESSSRADNTLREQYADLRKKLRETGISLTETQKQEAANEAGSYNDYRKSMMGTVKLVNDGISLDAIWGELSSQHPELFPADTGEGEMVGKLTDFMLLMKPRYENPYGMDMDGAAVELAMRIQGDVMGLIGAKDAAKAMYGTANKFRKQFEDDFKKSLAEQRQARVERFRQIAEDLRAAKAAGDKTEQAKVMNRYRAAMRASGLEDAYAEVRATYRERENRKAENRKANEMRGRVAKQAGELMRMFTRPEKGKRIPTQLQGLILEVLETLDLNGTRAESEGRQTQKAAAFREKLAGIRKFYEDVMNSQSRGEAPEGLDGLMMTISERNLSDMQEALEVLGSGDRFYLRDMNVDQLRSLENLLKNIRHTVESVGKLWRMQRYASVIELGDASIEEMDSRDEQKLLETSAAGKARDFLALDMLEPVSYGERLGEGGRAVIQNLMDGEKIKFARIREAAAATGKMRKAAGVTGYDIGKWRKNVRTVTLGSGRVVKMSDVNIMELYLTANRPQGMQHLLGNGMRIRTTGETGAQTAHVQLSEADIRNISGMMTEKQRRIADMMQKYLSGDVAKWGNDVTQRMYLYDAFTEDRYWPLTSDPNNLKTQEPEGDRAFSAIVNAGFTKPINRLANNPVIIGDAFETFGRHISEMASYAGYAEAMTDTMAWINYRQRTEDGLIAGSVKQSMERLLGTGGQKYLTKLVQDINGARRGGDGTQLNKLLGNYKKAAVMGKIRVAIQQPTSIVRAAAEIGPGYLVGGLKADRDALAEMHRWSSLAWWKSNGNYEMGIGRSTDAILWGETSRADEAIDKAARIGALGLDPGAMDDWAWTRMWSAVKRETDRTRPELRKGSDEYFRAVAERFEYIMDRTQVVDTVMHRSDLMRSKDGLIKSLTSFKAEPTKAYNMLIRAAMDLGRNPKNRDARVRMARTAAAFVSSAAATALATAFFDAFKNRDDDDPIWEYLTGGEFMKDLSEAFISGFMDSANIAASVPVLGEMLEAAQGRDVTMMQFEGIANIGNAATTFTDHFFGENAKKTTKWGAMKPAITTISQLTGLPASGIIANAEALLRAFDPDLMRVKSEMAKLDDAYRVLYEAMKKGDSKKALSIRTQLAKGLHGNTPKNPKEIDTGIAHALAEHDERVMQAYNLRTAGSRTKELLALKKQIMADGFTDAQVTAAINYCESLLNTGKAEKDMEAQLTAKLFTSKDLFSAIRTGGAYDVNEIADYLESVSTANDPAKSIKNSVSGEFKQEYLGLTDSGRTREAEALAGKLALVGIDEDDLAGWVKSDRYQRMKDAVDAGSTSEAKRYIDKLYESGASTSDVVSSLNGRYEEMYVSLMRSGKRTQANRLRETLQALGLFWKDGRTNYYRDEVLEKWLEEAE